MARIHSKHRSASGRINRLGWGLPLLLAARLAMAQEAALSEAMYLEEMPQVLTASRIAQSPMDAPAPVTVIDREMIRASGFTEIHDLFRLVPGFIVADWPEGPPVVVNHGLGDAASRRLQVLVDGRSVYDPFRGGVDWNDLSIRLDEIERIEVVRAANQAVYGANAFQGVINIVTQAPAVDAGTALSVSQGRRGFSDVYARLGRRNGDVDWRLSASHRDATQFRDLGVMNSLLREFTHRQTLDSQVAWRPDVDQEWRAHLGLTWGVDEVGSSIPALKTPYHDREGDGQFFQLAWHRSYAADSELSMQYYSYRRQERERFINTDGVSVIPIDLDVDMVRDDLELQQIHSFSKTLRGVWGAGVRRDQVRSEHYLYQLGTVRGGQWQLFGNLDWQVAPDWLLHAGGMVEKHYHTDTLFSPRLAVNYLLAPSHSLRVSGGRGYRAPTFHEATSREVFGDGAGGVADVGTWSDRTLEPERVTFREIGYVGRFDRVGLQVDARLFRDDYANYIDNQSCTMEPATHPGFPVCSFWPVAGYARPAWFGHHKAFYFYNSGDIRVEGGDLTLDWHHRDFGRFVLSHAVTHIRAGVMTDADTELSAPRVSSSLLWMKTFPKGIRTSVGYYRVGFLKWPNDGDEQWAYRRLDLKLAKRLGPAGSEDEIALTLQNVGAHHTEFDDYTVERQAFVTLRLSW